MIFLDLRHVLKPFQSLVGESPFVLLEPGARVCPLSVGFADVAWRHRQLQDNQSMMSQSSPGSLSLTPCIVSNHVSGEKINHAREKSFGLDVGYKAALLDY